MGGDGAPRFFMHPTRTSARRFAQASPKWSSVRLCTSQRVASQHSWPACVVGVGSIHELMRRTAVCEASEHAGRENRFAMGMNERHLSAQYEYAFILYRVPTAHRTALSLDATPVDGPRTRNTACRARVGI